ncbi:MAG: hypothetical protein ALECFALPRED_006945 [Alectoria fallacina]|uniref:asparaginase n=1 Tax=Alectoria fallacina TaxID=1903189 RepID=A0A8H3G4M2_9LECA|nr:MAG: hypothetical protein ALECFALPRED_006945 [Alectoria fallacina]
MTGGTICMKRSPNGFIPARGFLQSGMAPRPSFNDGSNPDDIVVVVDDGTKVFHRSLRTPISTYQKHVRYAVFEFQELLDSSSIDAEEWSHIAQTIFRNYKLFDSFVILHGTDSLAYTCSALSFMLQNLGKPVILTGSQAPMLELQNDAVSHLFRDFPASFVQHFELQDLSHELNTPETCLRTHIQSQQRHADSKIIKTDNLLGSLIVAGHFMIPEVCLFFNYKLFRGNRSTKISASAFAAFASPNAPPLGYISSLKTHVSWGDIYRPTHLKPFSIQTNRATGDVACLRIFPGIEPRMVEAVLQLDGLKGLVLETFGSGNAPGGPDGALTKVFANAIKRGIVIVNVTQCMTGTVSSLYEPAMMLKRVGVIPGHDMTSEAALAKLSYLLATPGLSIEDIIQKMSVSLRGELTDSQANVVFEHPSGVLPNRLANLASLGYAISKGDVLEIQKLLNGDLGWLLNEADYCGNTPLV